MEYIKNSEEKVIEMLRKSYNKLAVKITFGIIVVLLPIIIFIVFISNLMVNNLKEKILDSYRDELAINMTRIDSQISVIEEDINNISTQNWPELNLGSSSNTPEIEEYAFWKELTSFHENLDMVDYCFIKTNWNNFVAITYDTKSNSYNESEQIKQYLVNKKFSISEQQNYQYITAGGKGYIIRSVCSSYYSFGFIIDVNMLLSKLQKAKTSNINSLFIATKEGAIRSGNCNVRIALNERLQKVKLNGKDTEMLVITYPSSKANYYLVQMLPEDEFNSQIPVLEKIFQVISLGSIIIIPIIYYVVKRLVLTPLFRLNRAICQIEKGNMEYRIETTEKSIEFQHISGTFNRMADQIKNLTIQSYENDIEKLQIEATNLRLQVNPHMLLNSLNMIYSLSLSKNYSCIEKFTLCLVEYFRYSLHQNEKLVELSDEMKFVNSYIEIQKIRFPNRFTYTYDIDGDLFDELVPPLLIENFVENSIKYGIKSDAIIKISVSIIQENNKLNILICDTGRGIDDETLERLRENEPIVNESGKHIGIWNCKRRLKMYYGDKTAISISSAINRGTQVRIQIPMSGKGEE